jgi:DNA-binding transcriptional ArsR family regulator
MVLNREQLACFESPVKASIIAALRALGPSSARELSQLTGGSTGALYHHLRRLMAVGLVRVAEVRPAETRPEAVYELTAPEFYMRGAVGDQEYRLSVFRSAKNILRLAQRQYENALEHVEVNPELEEAMRFNFMSARLSRENLAKLRADMEALLLQALRTNDPDGQPVIFAGILAPTSYEENPGR